MGHGGVVIQVRVMLGFLLDDGEDPGGRLTSLLATRYRRSQDPTADVIDCDPLIAERNDGHDRLAGGTRLDGLDRALAAAAPGVRMISRRDQGSHTHHPEISGPRPCQSVLCKTRRHVRRSNRGYPVLLSERLTPFDRTCHCGNQELPADR